ncbi:aminopeptidase [Lysinibacillus sp. NPDC094403]|uniref:aminopeptidase n=1 Tax=Lysinibacillus sp. NPDC094403 TaxID=3390581 RepID=UPI003D013EA5
MLLSFDTKLLKYAELAVKSGENIQKNQLPHISSSNDKLKLIQIIIKIAYKNGTKQVFVELSDAILFLNSLRKRSKRLT